MRVTPSPSCPLVSAPQQLTTWSALDAQLCSDPALTAPLAPVTLVVRAPAPDAGVTEARAAVRAAGRDAAGGGGQGDGGWHVDVRPSGPEAELTAIVGTPAPDAARLVDCAGVRAAG